MCLGQYISNTEFLDLWQLCEIDEKQCNMGPLKYLCCMFHIALITSCKRAGIESTSLCKASWFMLSQHDLTVFHKAYCDVIVCLYFSVFKSSLERLPQTHLKTQTPKVKRRVRIWLVALCCMSSAYSPIMLPIALQLFYQIKPWKRKNETWGVHAS